MVMSRDDDQGSAARRRRRTWALFAAAVVPLAALLGLQYFWLERLEQASAAAHRATLDNVL